MLDEGLAPRLAKDIQCAASPDRTAVRLRYVRERYDVGQYPMYE